MGAEYFETEAKGKTADAAFKAARKRAQYDHGHAGYTGTIAEKSSFVVLPTPDLSDKEYPGAWYVALGDYAYELCRRDPRIDDKWGPCGCFDLGKGKFYFFGYASS